ncbi:MAG: hypothetical protein ACK6CU_03425 [Deltaproteobacteria bacterium]|jgi:hypothetical protein
MRRTAGVLLGLLLAWCATSAFAQDAMTSSHVARGRTAARGRDFELAAQELAAARAGGARGLDLELALAAWQAGRDAEAFGVLDASAEPEADLLSYALRRDLDPARVLSLPRESLRNISSELSLSRAELVAAQVLAWMSALGGSASLAVELLAPRSCQAGCGSEAIDISVGLALGSLAALLGSVTLASVGSLRRDAAESVLRLDARGAALLF